MKLPDWPGMHSQELLHPLIPDLPRVMLLHCEGSLQESEEEEAVPGGG